MALVDYVMLHELCHLRHMNHSKDFWQLLTQYLPDCRQRQVALARENLNIPEWIDGFKS
jgi:predicted metal-dependent hydrolase